MYGVKNIISKGNRRDFPITDRLKGCNSILTTKSELAAQMTIPESHIKNLTFDNANNEITWHTTANYQISRSFSFSGRTQATSNQQALAVVVEEFESEKLTSIDSFLFSESNIKVLKLYNLLNIPNEGLRDLTKIKILEIPKLRSFRNSSLIRLAINNGASPVQLDFPLLQNFGGISGRFVFTNYLSNVTSVNDLRISNWVNQTNIPFPQSLVNINNTFGFFRNMSSFSQDVNFINPLVTTLSWFNFSDCPNITSIKLPNVTTINHPNGYVFRQAGSLVYLDIKKCTTLLNDENRGRNLDLSSNGGVIEVNIALQNYQGNGIHWNIQRLLNRGWTVNWYDDNGDLVTTTN